jgi:hypothetical protein
MRTNLLWETPVCEVGEGEAFFLPYVIRVRLIILKELFWRSWEGGGQRDSNRLRKPGRTARKHISRAARKVAH